MSIIKAAKVNPIVNLTKLTALTQGKTLITAIGTDEDMILLSVRKLMKQHDNVSVYVNYKLVTRMTNSGFKVAPLARDMGVVRENALKEGRTIYHVILIPLRKLTSEVIADPARFVITQQALLDSDLHYTALADIDGKMEYHINKVRGEYV